MADHLLVLTTIGSDEEAGRLARTVIERGAAACANILSLVRSVYLWKDAIEDHNECLVLFKTRADKYEALEATIREVHSYEVPEVIAFPIERGSKAYLAWIDEALARTASSS
jgi:periplasmic divalent cation tolerance protein